MRKLRRCVRALSVIALGFVMLVPVMMVVPEPAIAAGTTTFYTHCASAKNSTYWSIYPKYSTGVTVVPQVEIANEAMHKTISTTALTVYVETNDFTEDEWYHATYIPDEYYSGEMPPDNATLLSVYMEIRFSWSHPELTPYFSINDKGSWGTGSTYPESTTNTIVWNITDAAAWTPAMLRSDDTWCRLKMLPSASVSYYLDYIGLSVMYTLPYGSGGAEEDDLPGFGDKFWTYDLSGGGIIGVFGVVGLCGLIATPAWAAWSFKNSDDSRVVVFVKAIVVGMFSLSLFLVSFA